MSARAQPEQTVEDLIKVYKQVLATIIDKRPSGTRQRIADALGKHRSFVTQMTSTAYPTPVPERHLSTIFSVCHFSAEEIRQFLTVYHEAHPDRKPPVTRAKGLRHVSLMVLDLGDDGLNRRFDEAIAEFAHRISALMGTEKT
jgi:hypothetical protein